MKNGSVLLISYILLDCCILLNYGAIVFSEPLVVAPSADYSFEGSRTIKTQKGDQNLLEN